MSSPKLELYAYPASSACRLVTTVMELLGLDYEYKITNLQKGDHLTPEFLKMNPQHSIPTLKDGDFCLAESRAIATYLVAQYGKTEEHLRLYPEEPKLRAKINRILFFELNTFYKAFGDVAYPPMFPNRYKAPFPELSESKLREALAWCEEFVSETGHAGGAAHFTVADIALASTYSNIDAMSLVDLAAYPKLRSWFENFKSFVGPGYEKCMGDGARFMANWYLELVANPNMADK